MCGIAGIVAIEASARAEHAGRMIDAIAHRGPDGRSVKVLNGCCLAHARLSVVDLKTGDQPMKSPVSSRSMVFNGEVYGYRSIRAAQCDYPFATTSDTEVVLALFDRYGESCLDHLPGMFAFAIWDSDAQELFCARDRFGEKPFFYAWGRNGEFLFASEIKAILASGLVDPVISRDSVVHYLRHLYVHPARTIYENVHTLPPGHRLTVSGGKARVERYWSLSPEVDNLSLGDAVERFRELFERSVRNQLVADVPVGAFLSGGVDSTSVVAAASKHQADLRSFSFGFEDSVSELPLARESSRKYGTVHTETTAASVDIAQLLLKMQTIYDEPFADSSNIPTYLLCGLASEQLKVVLTGDGGDELLGGYGWWYQPLLAGSTENSDKKHGLGEKLIARIAAAAGKRGSDSARFAQGASNQSESLAAVHARQNIYFSDSELSGLFGTVVMPESNNGRFIETSDQMNDVLRMDLEDYMPGDILVKVDRASMAHGLELRAPFLDVDFATFCVSLPSSLKLARGRDKIVLREAYSSQWTKPVQRASKRGFGAPVSNWLKRPTVKALVDDYLNDRQRTIFSMIDFGASRAAVAQGDYKTWILLVLALWLESDQLNRSTHMGN
jgi:asparagine synthase (glutamine-hydrolysing)